MNNSNRFASGWVHCGDGRAVSEPLAHVSALVLGVNAKLLQKRVLVVCKSNSHDCNRQHESIDRKIE